MTEPILTSSLFTISGHLFRRATLNAPDSLNALSLQMIDMLAPKLEEWAKDPHVAGVILDAEGDRAFCAGGDVVALYQSIRGAAPGQVPAQAAEFFEREYRLDYLIHTYPKPLLCWGNGIIMGGGIGLFAGASHRVVTPKTRLAMPEISIGLYPDVGGSWFLPRMPGQAGQFLALTGASLNASDALFTGMADVAIAHEGFGGMIENIAATKWTGEPENDAMLLSKVLEGMRCDELPQANLQRHARLIDEMLAVQDLDTMAKGFAALSTHEDKWLAQAAQSFLRGSPTSAHLALAMQERTRGMSLADVFRLEYQASVGCCMHNDFAEGVRALLIDKDKTPRWQPATLAEVNEQYIEAHLLARHQDKHPLADLD